MGGFSSNTSGKDVVFSKNVNFSGDTSDTIVTNGQLLIGSTALNAGGTHINVGTLTSPGSSITIGYASPNITLDVNSAGITQTLTPDSGGAIFPIAGNINVFGQKSLTSQVMMTTQTPAGTMEIENRSYTTRYIVDPSATIGIRGTYTTVQAAINAAVADGATGSNVQVIYIRPGTYIESILIPDTAAIALVGSNNLSTILDFIFTFATSSYNVILQNIQFLSSGAYALTATGGTLEIYDCIFNGDAASGTILTLGSVSNVIIYNTQFIAGLTGLNGTGGPMKIYNCDFSSSWITFNGSQSVNFYNCELFKIEYSAPCTTAASFYNCNFTDNTALEPIISGTAGATQRLYNNTFAPNSAVGIAATGTFLMSGNVCENNNLFDTNPTIIYESTQSGNIQAVTLPAGNHVIDLHDTFVGVDTSSPRSITMYATPFKGLTYTIADITGSAGANNITINGNGSNIDGAATYTVNSNYGSITLVYTGTIWKVT